MVERLNATGVFHALKIDVAKENFATRPALILDASDRLAYQALIDRVSKELISDLDPFVFGWRLYPSGAARGKYARNDHQWTNFRHALVALRKKYQYGLCTDVVSYFASVQLPMLEEMIFQRAKRNQVSERLVGMLHGWAQVQGRSGIPQRSLGSAVLANMFLRPVDDVLRAYSTRTGRFRTTPACRWMDDIWLFARKPERLREAQLRLQDAMRDLGLNMNLAKTDVLEGEELACSIDEMQHSGVDAALNRAAGKMPSELGELTDRLLRRPERASRPSVRFVTHRMRQHALFGRVPDFVESACRMPHASDVLARLFRDSEAWRDLATWYLDYSTSEWAAIDWSVGQLGTMFPSSAPRSKIRRVMDFFADAIGSRKASPTLFAVAVQRLCSWDRENARALLRESAKNSNHPFERRILALAAISVGEERAMVKRTLCEFAENAVTLAMLEDRRFKPFDVSDDFAGDAVDAE
jgi:hypothetical protein